MPIRWTSFVALMGFLALCTACGGGGGGGTIVTPGPTGLPPAAQIFLNDATGLPSTLQFYGQGADPECGALTYSWDLDGDGSEDSTLQSPSFTYAADGERIVTLTVTDTGGNTATARCTVSISAAAPPAMTRAPGVQLRCSTLLGEEGLETLLIAQADDLDAGSIISYMWDLDGDGAFDDLTTATRTTTATIAGPGQVTLGVRATSDDGSMGTATCTLFLCADGTLPDLNPGLQIESDDVANGPGSFSVGSTAVFLASGGDVDGGTLASIVWDTDDDLLFDDATGRTITTAAWPFPAETPYRVRARAVDEEGRRSDAQAVIVTTFAAPSVDRFPEVQVRALTTLGSTHTPIQFIGRAFDRDGNIDTIEWDIDGDRDFDDGTTKTPTFTFTERGVYMPTMRVTDTLGNVSEAWMTLVVECCTAAPAGPYWWCDCDDKSLGHGANVQCPIDCPVGAGPTEAGVWYCNGQMGVGGDPACSQVTVTDPGGGAPIGPLPMVTAPFTFGFRSDFVDGPARAVGYTVALKLREPGVRVQILKCQINVVHDLTSCFMPLTLGPPTLGGTTQFGDLVFLGGPGLQEPILQQTPIDVEIVALQLVGADQTPVWAPGSAAVPPAALRPAGWGGFADQIQNFVIFDFFDPLAGNPIHLDGRPGALPVTAFQLSFADEGSPPQMGEVRFLDGNGYVIAVEPVTLQAPPP